MAPSMNLWWLMALTLISISMTSGQNKSKYSKDANAKPPPPLTKTKEIAEKLNAKNPFRMQKFNIFWDKVKSAKHLDGDQKTQLFMDLAAHDQGEIELKHSRVSKLSTKELRSKGPGRK